jgi:hypothetical protein
MLSGAGTKTVRHHPSECEQIFAERTVVSLAESPGPRAGRLLAGHWASQSARKTQCKT